jgi:hypothetical protein
MSHHTVMDLVKNLQRDPDQMAAFRANPQGFLQANGFGELTATDVLDATPSLLAGATPLADVPAAPTVAPGDTSLQSAVDQLQFVNQNFRLNQDIDIDQSKRFDIDQSQTAQAIGEGSVAGTGDISGVATGAGSLAAADDIDIQGQVATTGGTAAGPDANVFQDSPGAQAIEDSNVLQGQGNVGGFGDGAVSNAAAGPGGTATSANLGDVTVGDGSGFAVGGDASGNAEVTAVQVDAQDNAQVNVAADDSEANQIDDIDASNETVTEIDISEEIDASQRLQQDIDSEGDTTVLG